MLSVSPKIPAAEIIARRRRQQPIAELERKARKAKRSWSEEAKDLSFAKSHAWSMTLREDSLRGVGPVLTFCRHCSAFASEIGAEPVHNPRCTFANPPPEVYSGTLMAYRARPLLP